MFVFGTAGHINHGKTAVVKALTGKDCDSLSQEKKRGITIELGFAQLTTPKGTEVALIDVPGHAKLLKTMASGAAGLQGVLMVISAEAGVMPQTREHINVCSLLGIRKGIVVITHGDKVEDPEFAMEFIREELQETFLADAPMCLVCPPKNEGIEGLKTTLEDLAAKITIDAPSAFTALPIDRVFTKEGYGTVVTGSLMAGRLEVQDEIILLPSKKSSRIRALQQHGTSQTEVKATSRTAVNCPDFSVDDILEGSLLTKRDELRSGKIFDAKVHWLTHNNKPLARRRGLSLYFHATQALAHVQALESIQPGEWGMVRIRLDRPIPLIPNGRFLLRGPMTPKWGGIVGGGQVVDAGPPHRRRRKVRLALYDTANPLSVLLEEAGPVGISSADILSRLGIVQPKGHYFFEPLLNQRRKDLVQLVQKYHQKNPQSEGVPLAEIRQSPLDIYVLDAMLAEKKLLQYKAFVHHPSFHPPDEEALNEASKELLGKITKGRYTPDPIKALYSEKVGGPFPMNVLAQHLVKNQLIIKVGDFYFSQKHMTTLAKLAALALSRNEELSVAWLKERTGATRKHAIPLFEYLDKIVVSQRQGNHRVAGPRLEQWL